MKLGISISRHQNAQTLRCLIVTIDNKTFKINIPIWPVSALNSVGETTNWVNVTASMQTNQMTVPVNSTNGSVFFRLVRPY